MGTDPTRDDLPGGVLHLLILQALSRERLHGYGIAEYIESRSGDDLSIGEGTLYPTLRAPPRLKAGSRPSGASAKTTAGLAITG